MRRGEIGGPSINHRAQARLDAVARRPRDHYAVGERPYFCAVEALPLPALRRVASVDALRGFTMFWIIGADGAAKALAEILSGMGTIPSAAGRITTPTDRTRALTGLHRLSSQHGQHQGIT